MQWKGCNELRLWRAFIDLSRWEMVQSRIPGSRHSRFNILHVVDDAHNICSSLFSGFYKTPVCLAVSSIYLFIQPIPKATTCIKEFMNTLDLRQSTLFDISMVISRKWKHCVVVYICKSYVVIQGNRMQDIIFDLTFIKKRITINHWRSIVRNDTFFEKVRRKMYRCLYIHI